MEENEFIFIEDENVKYKVIREDAENFNTNVRYFDTKKDLAQHLKNIGYTVFYILREIKKLPDTINFITDNVEINYIVKTVEIEEDTKFNKRAWKIDTVKLLGDIGKIGFEYYIDEDKNIYRKTLSMNKIKRITKDTQPKVRIGTTYEIKIENIWNKFRAEEIEGGI